MKHSKYILNSKQKKDLNPDKPLSDYELFILNDKVWSMHYSFFFSWNSQRIVRTRRKKDNSKLICLLTVTKLKIK
jgi:hypothetical protein